MEDIDDNSDADSAEEEVYAGRAADKVPPQQQQIRLPVETERWFMEVAPTRDQQHALEAQEVWSQLQNNFALLSLSASLP